MASYVPHAQDDDADRLRRLHVRPIRPEERQRWDALVDQYHYLGLRSLFGKTLRYVAVADECWLALLGWQAAALKCSARDAWIGWPRVLHYQRLHLLANNARFLILPTAHVPNLASRVLALNLRRLSSDWQQIHGHPLLVAETFVDTARFTGACYRAANWQMLRHTHGFSRHNGRYRAHGQPKQVLIYPLHRRARYNPRTERFEPPSEPTIRRILQSAKAAVIDASLSDWLLGLTDNDEAVAVDGKTLRGAVRSDGTQVHLLSAFLQGQGVTVAQRKIPAKTNEIPEIKPLLEPLDLRRRVVTADALHTQRETARFLVEDKQAQYLLTVKANQPTLFADLEALSHAHSPPVRRDPR